MRMNDQRQAEGLVELQASRERGNRARQGDLVEDHLCALWLAC